jgi:uncharacterized protein YbaR (Trm112 family)
MAVDPQFLKLLVAPGTSQRLVEMPPDQLAALNAQIAKGGVKNRGGSTVVRQLAAALMTETGGCAFPIQDGIPILLTTEAIPIATSQDAPTEGGHGKASRPS